MTTTDSVQIAGTLDGEALRESYARAVGRLTFGLVRFHDDAVWVGRVAVIRFGAPQVGPDFVEWPIEGGLLARPGGRWRIEAAGGRVTATAIDHRPVLPRPLYDLSHLLVHLLVTRLYLRRMKKKRGGNGRPLNVERQEP